VCLHKAMKKHSNTCSCLEILSGPREVLTSKQVATWLKAYKNNDNPFGGLKVPSDELFDLIDHADIIFRKMFNCVLHMPSLHQRIFRAVLENSHVCAFMNKFSASCFEFVKNILRIFLRLRIYYVLKEITEKMKEKAKLKTTAERREFDR
jgi:hypothetical protein